MLRERRGQPQDSNADEGLDKGEKVEVQTNSMEEKELSKLQTRATELEGHLGANPVGSQEVVKEKHQDPNPHKASPILDSDEVGDSDNDVLVIDLSEEEEGEIVESAKNLVANEPKNLGAGEGQVGVWKFAKRCQEAKETASGQKFLGPRCQVMCPNRNQGSGVSVKCPCRAMPTMKNLGSHIQRVHSLFVGCIDKLRCPDCDEIVSAESLQHHIQRGHNTCNMKCIRGSERRTDRNNLSPHSSSTPKNFPGAPTARAHVRVTNRKRPSTHATIWVRNDIFRSEVYAHKCY